MTDTLEKEESKKNKKPCEEFENKLYAEMKKFLGEKDGQAAINETSKQIQDTETTDALSRILSDYLGKNAISDEEQKKLLDCMAFSIIAYMTRKTIIETIDEEMSKSCLAKAAFDCIDIDECIGVKATNGEKTGVAIIPKELIKDKDNEEIIKFVKTMPNFQEENLESAQFEILKAEQLKNEFSKAQKIISNKVAKTTEEEQCQN